MENGKTLYTIKPNSKLMRAGDENTMEYVSNIIGDAYKDWMVNQIVFISAPTGAGKTTFILEKLVEYAALNKRRILYLVNRRILKDQIEKKLTIDIKSRLRKKKDISAENIDNVIDVTMYQTIEEMCKKNPICIEETKAKYHYIISDECHYFFADSTFNTYTQLSYDWILSKKNNSNLIFISATIERIRERILRDNPLSDLERSELIQGERDGMPRIYDGKESILQYEVEPDYSYVDLEGLKGIDQIPSLVKEQGKWLIFVDSIDKGNKILECLKDEKIDGIFIDAQSRKNSEEIETVYSIIQEECFTQKVVVATSVLDNGVSIKDMELRNMIIMTDTREEFIQMLGRKRRFDNSDAVKLYIMQGDRDYFERRLRTNIEQRLLFINGFSKCKTQNEKSIILEKVMRYDGWYKCAKNLCYVLEGSLTLNEFSEEQYYYLQESYNHIIKRFRGEGDFAFINEQAEWISYEDASEIIKKLVNNRKDDVINIIEGYVDVELNSTKNEELRDKIRKDLIKLLNSSEDSNEKDNIPLIKELGRSSKGRPFSVDKFNTIMELLCLEYRMQKHEGKMKKIIKCESKNMQD